MAEAESHPKSEKPRRNVLKPAFKSRQRQKQRGPVTAIDTDGRHVWVVEAALRGSTPTITQVKVGTLPHLEDSALADPEKFGATLAKALSLMRVHPGSTIFPIPSDKQLLRNLTVPTAEDIRETASMVRFQVARDLPFSADDAVIDFFIRSSSVGSPNLPPVVPPAAGQEKDSKVPPPAEAVANTQVLAVAVRRDTITHCEKLALAAGIKVRGLGIRAEANCCALAACLPDAGQNQALALVTLSREGVQIDVFAQREVLFTRTATLPEPPDVSDASAAKKAATPDHPAPPPSQPNREAWVNKAVIETVRCLHGYSGSQTGGAIQKLLVTGATGFESLVRDALTPKVSPPCELFDPGTALELREDSHKAAAGATTAIGLALSALEPAGMRMDFLNPKRPAVQRDTKRLRILGGIALAAAAFLLLAAVRVQLVKKRTVVLRQLEMELAEAEKKRPLYRAMKQQAATVADWLKGQNDWLDHYAYLSAVLPSSEDIYLTSLSVNGSANIRMSVQARGGEILAKLDKQLRAAGYEVKPLAVNPGADRYGYDFRSTVELVIPPKMKPDLSKVRAAPRPRDDASLEPGATKGARP